ncbi:MAG: TonB family protein [bacterium]
MHPKLRLAVIISITAHATLIALVAWFAFHVYPVEYPGTNAVVAVWIEGPEGGEPGAAGSEGGAKEESRQRTPDRKTPSVRLREKESTEGGPIPTVTTAPEAALPSGEGKGEGKGKAEGAGTGEGGAGSGIGGGSGGRGNPILAAIWRKINSSKYYPPSARRRGITGSPRVSFAINQDGSIGWVKLSTTCGESELDAAALETVRRAAPLPYYAGPITLSIRYSLEK